jgi:hypothetical protein
MQPSPKGAHVRFTEVFDVVPTRADDWFDPFLETDTSLFVDPFLIWAEQEGSWSEAHDRLIAFFNHVLRVMIRSGLDEMSSHWHAVQRLLMFREPPEFCLGYGWETTEGRGSGRKLQEGMLAGGATAIELSIESVEHFEEMLLFQPGIGADRIGDIVCNVLKQEFIAYTQRVAKRHNIEMKNVRVRNAAWTEDNGWQDKVVRLPVNPYSRHGVLLTPARFLRELPAAEPEDLWEWAWSHANEDIRGSFNYDVARKVDRKVLGAFARANPGIVKRYLQHLEESPPSAYDLEQDPHWHVKWYEHARRLVAAFSLPSRSEFRKDFCAAIATILREFVHNVEQQDGWLLLWANDRPRSERHIQALFRGIVQHYCQANNIDLSGEANAGRGPVDFKMSNGWAARALIEIKKTENSKYWHGLREQLVQYLKSEKARCGYFMSVSFRDKDWTKERQDVVRQVAKDVRKETGLDIQVIFVDARPKESASRARSTAVGKPRNPCKPR